MIIASVCQMVEVFLEMRAYFRSIVRVKEIGIDREGKLLADVIDGLDIGVAEHFPQTALKIQHTHWHYDDLCASIDIN